MKAPNHTTPYRTGKVEWKRIEHKSDKPLAVMCKLRGSSYDTFRVLRERTSPLGADRPLHRMSDAARHNGLDFYEFQHRRTVVVLRIMMGGDSRKQVDNRTCII